MKITLLLQPSPRSLPLPAGPERYQRLADELGRHLGTAVRTVQSFSLEAVRDGYLLWVTSGDPERLLGDLDPFVAKDLAARTVLLDVSWQQALVQLERYRFAAAIDSLRLSEWLARPVGTKGPFGLNRLASVIGASCSPLPSLQSRHYCLLEGGPQQGMPHLLADYLRAYDQDRMPLSAFSAFLLARAVQPADRESNISGASGPGVERAGVKRTIATLKRAREQAKVTVLSLAELTGIEPEMLSRLEAGDTQNISLGVLREYSVAMKDVWGWCLAGVGEALCSSGDASGSRRSHQLGSVSASREEKVATGVLSPSVFEAGGYTVREANRRVRWRSEDLQLAEAGRR